MKPIYLDYASATPMAEEVLKAMRPFWQKKFQNPSSLYLVSRDNKLALEAARGEIAHWLGARSGEVVFTAGATEANHLALSGLAAAFPGGGILVGSTEHASVLKAAGSGSKIKTVPVDKLGRVNISSIKRLISAKTIIVSVHYANNETGVIQPLSQVHALIDEEHRRRLKRGDKLPLYFHTDASQAAQYLDLHVSRLGVDLMTISAGKIYGPKQVAALYVRGGVKLKPVLSGGGQERGLRSGTENIAGAAGLAAALSLVQSDRQQESLRISGLRDQLETQLKQIKKVSITGDTKHRLPNFLHFSVAGRDGERLVMELDEAGVQAATGAACSANSHEPSHVLVAMGLSDELIAGSIRLSLGRPTSERDIELAGKRILKVLA